MPPDVEDWVLRNGRIVDVDSGEVSEPSCLLVSRGRIARIAVHDGSPDDPCRQISEGHDAGGAYVAPGLVTVHTHLSIVFPFKDTDENEHPAATALRAARRAEDAILAGATTVRTVHEQHQIDLHLRKAAGRGWVRAPRILAGGRALSAPGGHGKGSGAVYCSGSEAFYSAAMRELEAGVDHIKIFITGGLAHAGESPADSEMTADEMAAVVRAASRHGAYVVAHAGHHAAIRVAIDAGVTSFEHAYDVDTATAAALKAADAYVSPTLVVTRCQDWMAANGFEDHSRENARRVSVTHLESARRLARAGVALTNGTDVPPGDGTEGTTAVVREAELLQEAVLSPLEALRASTAIPARMLGVDDKTGHVVEGKAADLLVVRENPASDVGALRTMKLVVAQGNRIQPAGGRRASDGI